MNLPHPANPPSEPHEALQQALRQYPGIIWTTDARSVTTSAFGGGLATLGLEPNQTVGMSLAEYFGTNDPQFPVLTAQHRVLQGQSQTVHMQWQGRDFEARIQPLCDSAGAVIGTLGIANDVTEQNRAARVLPGYVAQMRAGIEREPDFVMHIDRTGTITYVESPLPGYQPNLVIGTKAEQWLRPETLPIVEEAMRRVFVERQPQHLEIPAPGSNQPDRWYDVRLRPVLEQEQAVGLAAVVYDITERKIIELRLREQVELLAQVLANIPRGVMWKERGGAYLGCNELFARFLGLAQPGDVIGRRDADLLISPELTDWLTRHDSEVLEKDLSVLDTEQTLKLQAGGEVTLSMSKVPLRNAAGTTVGVLGTLADVTDLRRASEALRESEQRFRLLAENLPGVVYLCRNDSRYSMIYLNDAVEGLTGYSKGDFLEDRISFVELYHPEDARAIPAVVNAALARRESFHMTYRLRRKDGEWRWIEEFGAGIYRGGELAMLEGFLLDVTDRKQGELELREAGEELEQRVRERTDELTAVNRRLREGERRLQSILDNSTAIVYVKDGEGRYTLVNSQFSRLFHVTADGVLGKRDVDIFPAETAARFNANDRRVRAERRAIQFEETAPHDDGPHHYVSVKFPIGETSDGSCSVCGISTDITDRKKSEELLRSEERLLRRLLDLRERERMLLAYDIHDGLVQDIVGAKMMLEGRGGDGAGGGQFHEMPVRLDHKTHQQVLGLLVRAIDEGRRMISELRPPILDEQGIIAAIEYLIAEHLQKSSLKIHFRHDVAFDRLSPLLEQTLFRIVQEALNNFVRHSEATEAEVDLRQVGQRVRIEIRDCGVGFDPTGVLPDRFGLRGIVERARLFGGSAVIDSRPGEGTCVAVDVPIDQDSPLEM